MAVLSLLLCILSRTYPATNAFAELRPLVVTFSCDKGKLWLDATVSEAVSVAKGARLHTAVVGWNWERLVHRTIANVRACRKMWIYSRCWLATW